MSFQTKSNLLFIVLGLIALTFVFSVTYQSYAIFKNITCTSEFECEIKRAWLESSKKRIVTTSRKRSVEDQAKLIYSTFKRDNKLTIYKNRDVAKDLISLFKIKSLTKDKRLSLAEDILNKYMEDGIFLSKHLCGKAVDMRARNLSRREIVLFKKVVSKLGYKVIYERYPIHFHIEDKGDC